VDDATADNSRGVALRALHQTSPASRQVVDDLGSEQAQRVNVDDVQIGLVADGDEASVEQPDSTRRVLAEQLHHLRQSQPLASRSIAHPMTVDSGQWSTTEEAASATMIAALTVMTCRDTPDHESHDRPPLLPALLPQGEKEVS